MDRIYQTLKLSNFDEWFSIPKYRLIEQDKRMINNMLRSYEGNMYTLFHSIYPNYPWTYQNLRFKYQNKSAIDDINNKSKDEKYQFIEMLFRYFQITTFEDLCKLKKSQLIQFKGLESTLSSSDPKTNFRLFLSTLFPNYPWFSSSSPLPPSSSSSVKTEMEKMRIKHRLYVNKIGFHHGIYNKEEWLNISKRQFINMALSYHASSSSSNSNSDPSVYTILKKYSNNYYQLLSFVYNDYRWPFSLTRPHPHLFIKLLKLKREFHISRKEDWYRLPDRIHFISLSEEKKNSSSASSHSIRNALKKAYPEINWSAQQFNNKFKKFKQRRLYIMISYNLFSNQHVHEGFRHPCIRSDRLLEFDIFIPEFNLAVEYNGEQHYDDMPFSGSQIETYQSNDTLKIEYSSNYSISILFVPYWWNQTLSSLQSLLSSHFANI